MSHPDRAARLWLAVAVATLWLLSVGGEADETIPASTLLDVTALVPGAPADAAGDPPAAGERVSPRLGAAAGGAAAPGAVAGGPLGAGTLARRAAAGGRPLCAWHCPA